MVSRAPTKQRHQGTSPDGRSGSGSRVSVFGVLGPWSRDQRPQRQTVPLGSFAAVALRYESVAVPDDGEDDRARRVRPGRDARRFERRYRQRGQRSCVEDLGGAPLPASAVIDMVGEGAPLLVRRALAAASLDPDTPGALDRFLALYDTRLLVHTRPYDGTIDALTWIGERLPMSVLTNKPAVPTSLMLDGLGLRHHFRDVVGGDTRVRAQAGSRGVAAPRVSRRRPSGRHADGRGFADRSRDRAQRRHANLPWYATGLDSGSARRTSVGTSCSSIRRRGWWICCGESDSDRLVNGVRARVRGRNGDTEERSSTRSRSHSGTRSAGRGVSSRRWRAGRDPAEQRRHWIGCFDCDLACPPSSASGELACDTDQRDIRKLIPCRLRIEGSCSPGLRFFYTLRVTLW